MYTDPFVWCAAAQLIQKGGSSLNCIHLWRSNQSFLYDDSISIFTNKQTAIKVHEICGIYIYRH